MKQKITQAQEDSHEHALVRRDFTFVVTLNLILLAAMFALFFWNRSTGTVDDLFTKFIRF
jgi:hypothetical protein